jgi:dUTP pyrophosphatase
MKILPTHQKLVENLPSYATDGSAGLDVKAAIDAAVTLRPGEQRSIPLGFKMELPPYDIANDEDGINAVGLVAELHIRSGLATKHGIVLANQVGIIDSDYRGEVIAVLKNTGSNPYTIRPWERIAQIVIKVSARAVVEVVNSLSDTARGEGGFGHTGRV